MGNIKGGVKKNIKKISRKMSRIHKPIGISKTNQIKNYENKYNFKEFSKDMFEIYKTDIVQEEDNKIILNLENKNVKIQIELPENTNSIYKVQKITKDSNPRNDSYLVMEMKDEKSNKDAILYFFKENDTIVKLKKKNNNESDEFIKFQKDKDIISILELSHSSSQSQQAGNKKYKKKTYKKKPIKRKHIKRKRIKRKPIKRRYNYIIFI